MDIVERTGEVHERELPELPFAAITKKHGQASAYRRPTGSRQSRALRLNPYRIARALAWIGVGLGVVELLFPRTLAKMIGAPGATASMLRALGLRKIASAALIFNSRHTRALGLWSRVGGDAMDVAMLSTAFACPHTNKTALKITVGGLLGLAAVDYLCAQEISRRDSLVAEHFAMRRQARDRQQGAGGG